MPYFRDLLITDPSRGESIFDMEPELVERVRKKMQGMVSKKWNFLKLIKNHDKLLMAIICVGG